ncbi:hypothetical protein [Paraburkholderia mimosarum]|uniref:hypothetical protein n=1 Tax=Paraburkholderia mimosarum TaxID=312026 RepID=UPI000407367C|nr:hypothetical protein [Paraburkholderia mimosarum]
MPISRWRRALGGHVPELPETRASKSRHVLTPTLARRENPGPGARSRDMRGEREATQPVN